MSKAEETTTAPLRLAQGRPFDASKYSGRMASLLVNGARSLNPDYILIMVRNIVLFSEYLIDFKLSCWPMVFLDEVSHSSYILDLCFVGYTYASVQNKSPVFTDNID